jgi:glycosyltransferase involved in cell wall biosynthesis
LKRRLQDERRQIILHSHLTHGFYTCLVAGAGLSLRWVHTEHNTTMRLRKIPLMRPIERKLYGRCDKILAISNGVGKALEDVLEINPNQIALVQNGVHGLGIAEREALGDRELRIVSVGSLNERKGFHTALRALKEASIGSWHYTIVGEGPELSNLQALTEALGISEQVTFTGWADPAQYYRNADLQIIPSQWEGFGLVAVEGMSTGLRLIASDVEGLREVVSSDPEIGCLVDSHLSSSSWVGPLETVAAELRRLGTTTSLNSSKRARLFTLDRMVDGHVSLYQSLLAT